MHRRQCLRFEVGQPLDRRHRRRREVRVAEEVLRHLGGAEDVAVGQRPPVAQLGEQITAQQGRRRLLEQEPRLPGVGDVRRVEVAKPKGPDDLDLAVGEGPGRPVGHLVQRHRTPEAAVGHLRVGSDRQELVHRAALVGLDVTERNPPQPLHRHDPFDGLAHGREHRAVPRVEQERLVVVEQELVEGEAGRPDRRGEGRQPVDPRTDLGNVRGHGLSLRIYRGRRVVVVPVQWTRNISTASPMSWAQRLPPGSLAICWSTRPVVNAVQRSR